ncbi:MAG: right-handed parallel beta-helix repeat-containing protein, partial [Bacteroidetes bacterium]|nr:right-handed parallel beta-helix repeat-containing protein [Bacteroidota bacterium]
QTAINTAGAGDSIFVAQGTYQPASGQSFTMKDGVKIYGGFAGTETSLADRDLTAGHISTLNGNNGRVISNDNNHLSPAAELDGFTVANGHYNTGAGMYNNLASPTVRNCAFRSNLGGGIYNASSATAIVNCVFWQNTDGGTTSAWGGGVTNMSSTGVSIVGCLFTGNYGRLAGGVYFDDLGAGSASITNCTFWANGSNTLPGGVGGIYCESRSAPVIRNSILWGDGTEIHVASGTNPTISNNVIQGGYAGNLGTDPLFVNSSLSEGPDNIFGTADDGLILSGSSLALNAGTADTTGLSLPAMDLAGAPRIQGGKIDIGAYESGFTCGSLTRLYVDSSVAASGDGSSWAAAYKTLDEALSAAGQCAIVNSIYIAKGTYKPYTGKNFCMLPHVSLYGGFPSGGGSIAQRNTAANTTRLQGSGSSVVYNRYNSLDPSAVLDGFTITGGATDFGGGMYNLNSSPTINNCIISNNTATNAGGGIYNKGGSSPVITNCIFSGNTQTLAGGAGGAMYNTNGSPLISNCVFHDNSADFGGAIDNELNVASPATSPIIKNTVFANNSSGHDGAAIGNFGTSLTLSNVTIANNVAGRGGGAIDNASASLTATNSVFWGNTDVNGYGDIWWESGSGGLSYSFTQASWAGTGNQRGAGSPFVDVATPAGPDGVWGTADDGLSLVAGSPGIDAGTPDPTSLALGSTDIAGNPRVAGSAIDMGAYETLSAPLPITLLSFTGVLDNGVANLQWRTGVESGFDHFELEKSIEGRVFIEKAQIPAKASGSIYMYGLAQQEPTAWYRLRVVDNDGSAIYSRILVLSQRPVNEMLVYPNPAKSFILVRAASAGYINIYSADGRPVKVQSVSTGVNTVDVSGLNPGVYYGLLNGRQIRFIKMD